VLAVLLRDLLPPLDVISAWSERLVGGALIALGFWALRTALKIHAAPHTHGRVTHDHLRAEGGPPLVRRSGHTHASFFMGVLHGLAGSSHFLGVLPALALPTRAAALAYIVAFGVGSIVAMTGFGAALGAAPGPRTHRMFMLSAAVIAFTVGGAWLLL
jgi:hypothetical protein